MKFLIKLILLISISYNTTCLKCQPISEYSNNTNMTLLWDVRGKSKSSYANELSKYAKISNCKNSIRITNSISIGCSLGSLTVGTVLYAKSRKTYNRYLNVRNEILYTTNSFSQDELEVFELSRNKLLKQARKQRIIGSSLFGLSGSFLSIYIFIGPFDFKLQKCAQRNRYSSICP